MSYIDFDHNTNSILICKGDAKKRKQIIKSNSTNDFNTFVYENKFVAVEIIDFLSPFEQDGIKGELQFKQLLEKNDIPYLYIGQGPFGIERSGVLLDKMKSKRADYLVNIKDMGTILFDVKCRNKISFHTKKEKLFSIFISELKALKNLQDSILMPVWLAFIERKSVDTTPKFHFISISSLSKFWFGLSNYYTDANKYNEITVLRIPNELFTKIDEKIVFEVGYKSIDKKILNNHAKLNIGLNRFLKDKIKETIRNKSCFKSKIFEELQSADIDFCYASEVNLCLENMIRSKVIEFTPKMPLKLFGE
ncbi:hypothetical protein [Daejeonia sp. YH14]|uniref:hypothetical protein n=1 Tax=Daejeonia sp. YH14 TaxID=3439042 RepID=UPI003F496C90